MLVDSNFILPPRASVGIERPENDGLFFEQSAAGALVADEVAEPSTAWSIGEFGAIAEFHHFEGCKRTGRWSVAGDLGSLSLTPGTSRPVAYEVSSGRPGRWLQGLALCLPALEAVMHGRETITELGPDVDAAKSSKRHEILFDLGLGLTTADFCVRTGHPELIRSLRSAQGLSLFGTSHIFDLLRLQSPDRVVLSRLGRIEVEQRIPDPHGVAPEGPHTHLLPKLLGRTKVHASTLKVPEGWLPCVFAYPANPLSDGSGNERAFDTAAHARFQNLFEAWGLPELLDAKQHVWRALRENQSPSSAIWAMSRHQRLAMRIALRQACAEGLKSDTLEHWQRELDRSML